MKKLVKILDGIHYDENWNPLRLNMEQAQKLADKMAAKMHPHGFWHGCIFETENYFRINFGGQAYKIL